MCAVCAVRVQAAAGFVLLQCRMCGKRLRVCEGTVTDLSTLLSVGRSLTHMPTQQQNTAAITTRWFWWVTCIQRRSRRAAWKDRLLGSYSCFNPDAHDLLTTHMRRRAAFASKGFDTVGTAASSSSCFAVAHSICSVLLLFATG